MIAPNMSTMLAYLATDASIATACLQQMLEKAVSASFNAITVDSDTSTSDSVYLLATHKADHQQITDMNSKPWLAVHISDLLMVCFMCRQQIDAV